jgi:hypothetical protein
LIDHGLSGAKDDFVWEGASEPVAAFVQTLELTDEDTAELETQQAEFHGELQTLLETTSHEGAKQLFDALWRCWPEKRDYNYAIRDGFHGRLEARWGKAFDGLRMMLYMSLEDGYAKLKRLRASRAKRRKGLPHILLRLHTRACQVVGEIIALLEAGYADGANARWRTLHEITVVALVIVDGGEELAQRYVDHDAVSQYKAALLHQANCAARQERPFSKLYMARAKAEYEAALALYGKNFRNEYGWAADHLGNPDPKFSHLEDAAGHASVRPEYRLASYNVHAGSRGIFFKLGTMDGTGFVAGATDAGFEDPGCATAEAIVHINATLMSSPPTIDQLIRLWAFAHARDATRDAFARAARKLRRDHARIQRERAATKASCARKP